MREKYQKAKQDHVLKYYDELNTERKAALWSQLSAIDPAQINDIYKSTLHSKREENKPSDLNPLPTSACASLLDSRDEDTESWYNYGLQLVAENKVGVVLMAGGQGTRLGSADPKGCYNVGLLSEKSLFQLQAERIVKLQTLAARHYGKENVVVSWYIMTSKATTRQTRDHFEKHACFGLDKQNVMFFEQGTLPCLSDTGKILLESKSEV